jgi:hypothetical protein
MPSDPRVARALELLSVPIGRYRSAVATTLEEVRGHLANGRADARASARRLGEQLGPFAGGRIDPARLSVMLGDRDSLDEPALQRLQSAADALGAVLGRGDLFELKLAAGGDLAGAVSSQLATIGRAFAAARIASAARQGGSPSGLDEAAVVESFPFSEWTAGERRLAPPLVVVVAGADLVPGALAPFIDGALKMLLIVEAPSAPAPLVRLITPDVLVVQAHEFAELTTLAGWPGPAVGALVPAAAARFVHAPGAGPHVWQRTMLHQAAQPHRVRVGGFSPWQQAEELRQLETLAAHPPAATAVRDASSPTAAADPADHLAAWLLRQADLAAPGVGG